MPEHPQDEREFKPAFEDYHDGDRRELVPQVRLVQDEHFPVCDFERQVQEHDWPGNRRDFVFKCMAPFSLETRCLLSAMKPGGAHLLARDQALPLAFSEAWSG